MHGVSGIDNTVSRVAAFFCCVLNCGSPVGLAYPRSLERCFWHFHCERRSHCTGPVCIHPFVTRAYAIGWDKVYTWAWLTSACRYSCILLLETTGRLMSCPPGPPCSAPFDLTHAMWYGVFLY